MIRRIVQRLLFAITFLGLALDTAHALPSAFGIGKFELGGGVGYDFPLVQDDADLGPSIHLRGRFGLSPRFAGEATLGWSFQGDGEIPSGDPIEAPSLMTGHVAGVARAGGLGFATILRLGLGFTRISLPNDIESLTKFSWELGAAVELPIGPVRAELGPRFWVVDLGDNTRKYVELRLSAVMAVF